MRLQIVSAVSCAGLAFASLGTVRAQVEQARSFEVASVRLTDPPGPQTRPFNRVTDARLDWAHVSLRTLLLRAFQLDQPWQPSLLSGPDWMAGVYVEVHAVIPEGSTRQHVPEMLKTLLMTRFALRAHAEARPTDVYQLVVGSGGIRMQEVQAVDEVDKVFPEVPSRTAPVLDQIQEGLEGRLRSIFTDRGLITITERTRYERVRTDRGTYVLDAARITMARLAGYLSVAVERPVVDRTNLTGVYKLRIELPPGNWAPGLLSALSVSRTPEGTPINDPSGASAFKAVEELGLKLQPRRIPLDTIVVDAINRTPTAN